MKKEALINSKGKILKPGAPSRELQKVVKVPSNYCPKHSDKQYIVAGKQTVKRVRTKDGTMASSLKVTYYLIIGFPLQVLARFGGYIFRTGSRKDADKFIADMKKPNPNPFED